jgi:hypothetical protein
MPQKCLDVLHSKSVQSTSVAPKRSVLFFPNIRGIGLYGSAYYVANPNQHNKTLPDHNDVILFFGKFKM